MNGFEFVLTNRESEKQICGRRCKLDKQTKVSGSRYAFSMVKILSAAILA